MVLREYVKYGNKIGENVWYNECIGVWYYLSCWWFVDYVGVVVRCVIGRGCWMVVVWRMCVVISVGGRSSCGWSWVCDDEVGMGVF